MRVRVLQALGAVSVDLGEPRAASGYLNSALEWAQDVGDLSSLFSIYYALAVSHRAQADVEAATTYLQRALATSEVAHDVGATAIVHNMLAVIAADGGRLRAAYEHADRAIELGRMAGPTSMSRITSIRRPSALRRSATGTLRSAWRLRP